MSESEWRVASSQQLVQSFYEERDRAVRQGTPHHRASPRAGGEQQHEELPESPRRDTHWPPLLPSPRHENELPQLQRSVVRWAAETAPAGNAQQVSCHRNVGFWNVDERGHVILEGAEVSVHSGMRGKQILICISLLHYIFLQSHGICDS